MTCQTVGDIQLSSFNVKEKWEKRGTAVLIGWANKKANREEYKRKEEGSAEGKVQIKRDGKGIQ